MDGAPPTRGGGGGGAEFGVQGPGGPSPVSKSGYATHTHTHTHIHTHTHPHPHPHASTASQPYPWKCVVQWFRRMPPDAGPPCMQMQPEAWHTDTVIGLGPRVVAPPFGPVRRPILRPAPLTTARRQTTLRLRLGVELELSPLRLPPQNDAIKKNTHASFYLWGQNEMMHTLYTNTLCIQFALGGHILYKGWLQCC